MIRFLALNSLMVNQSQPLLDIIPGASALLVPWHADAAVLNQETVHTCRQATKEGRIVRTCDLWHDRVCGFPSSDAEEKPSIYNLRLAFLACSDIPVVPLFCTPTMPKPQVRLALPTLVAFGRARCTCSNADVYLMYHINIRVTVKFIQSIILTSWSLSSLFKVLY